MKRMLKEATGKRVEELNGVDRGEMGHRKHSGTTKRPSCGGRGVEDELWRTNFGG